jgi:hypothetical protein
MGRNGFGGPLSDLGTVANIVEDASMAGVLGSSEDVLEAAGISDVACTSDDSASASDVCGIDLTKGCDAPVYFAEYSFGGYLAKKFIRRLGSLTCAMLLYRGAKSRLQKENKSEAAEMINEWKDRILYNDGSKRQLGVSTSFWIREVDRLVAWRDRRLRLPKVTRSVAEPRAD